MTVETINKLEEVFAIGGSDKEACFYAGISHQALYDYQTKHPEFTERKDMLKEKPFLKARQTIVKALDNPKDAQWFMERKRSTEFGEKTESRNVNLNINAKVANPKAQKLADEYEQKLKETICQKSDSHK
jgi:hypothetical protein